MIISVDKKPVCDMIWLNKECMGDTDLHESISALIMYKLSSKTATHYSGKLTNLIVTTIEEERKKK